MNQKLIMENWRRFLKEEDELDKILEEYNPSEENLEEGVGSTLALLMGLWAGMAGPDDSLTVIGLDGEKHEISQVEFENTGKILNKVTDSENYGPAVDQSVKVFKSIDGDGAGPKAGTLDLRNIPNTGPYSAPILLDKIFNKVDQPDPAPSTDTDGDQGGQVSGTQSDWGAKLGNLQNQIDSAVSLEQPEKLQKLQQATSSWDVPPEFQGDYEKLMKKLNSAL